MVDDCLESPTANRFSLRKRLKMPILMRALKLKNNHVALDVGCGAGVFSFEMSKHAKKVVGLDYSQTNILAVKRRYNNTKNLEFKMGDATKMPFRSNTFDAILATEIMEHIEDDDKFASECFRVLKKGGTLVVTTPCTNPSISVDWFRRLAGINMATDFGHKRAGYTEDAMCAVLKRSGFRPMRTEYYDQWFGEFAWVLTCIPRIMKNKKEWSSGHGQKNIDKSAMFRIYRFIFPLIYGFAKLDVLLKGLRGHHIMVKSKK